MVLLRCLLCNDYTADDSLWMENHLGVAHNAPPRGYGTSVYEAIVVVVQEPPTLREIVAWLHTIQGAVSLDLPRAALHDLSLRIALNAAADAEAQP